MKKVILAFVLLAAGLGMARAQEAAEVDSVDNQIDNVLDQALLPAPDFTLKDMAGVPVSLSSFQGKWVVIDFWGSWCRWCIKGIPDMKEAYAKYHDKGLEIIGVDCGDTKTEWIEALGTYQLPWINLYCPDAKSSAVVQSYNIQGYPTKIIVNPEGYIYKVVIGEDPEFYQILADIFK